MKDLIPMLITKDLPGTIKFYTEVLGFQLDSSYSNDLEMTWASLIRGKVTMMFTIPFESQKEEAVKLSGTLYCYPEDVDDLWIELHGKVEVAWPIENFHYGMREFAIRDNNGYILSFGQEFKS